MGGSGHKQSTLVEDSTGRIINPAEEDGNLASILTKQSDGLQKTQVVDGSGNVIASTNNRLNVYLKPVKGIQAEILAIQTLAANLQLVSGVIDISGVNKLSVMIDHARDAATAFVGAGTEYRIEVSQAANGDNTWRTLYSVVCDILAASSIITDAEEASGQTVIETGATLPAVGDLVFFKHGTIGLSEWGKVVAKVTTGGSESFTIQDALVNTQPQQTMFNKAEQFVIELASLTFTRMRLVVNNNNGTTNQNIVLRAALITE